MKFLLKPTDPAKLETDVLLVFSWEKEERSKKNNIYEIANLGKELSQIVQEAMIKESFEGKKDQFLSISTHGLISSYKLLIVGISKKEDFTLISLYTIIAAAVRKAKETKPAKIALLLPDYWLDKFTTKVCIQAIIEAISLSLYHFSKYKGEEERKKIRDIEEFILHLSAGKIASGEEGIKMGEIISDATIFARDLINEPSEVTTPAFLAKTAQDIAKNSDGLVKADILEKEDAEKLGMGAFLAVARGSDHPPKFIHLKYKSRRARKKIVIIGKGLTFDAGGLSLKNPEHMETMKLDMSGAAAVLAIFKALSSLQPQVELVGLVAACENMPSGRALKPGDILHTMCGKTIEVLNTDAEGRLTLADAISFAVEREKPDIIIDLATLTGACMVALGQEIAGLWGNDETLLSQIDKSAAATGERIWRMPLVEDYKELIKSHIADIKNTQTNRYGVAISAALFLAEFVGKIPWVHLDIAGPAYAEKDTPLVPAGGAGFGVRLLLHYLTTIS